MNHNFLSQIVNVGINLISVSIWAQWKALKTELNKHGKLCLFIWFVAFEKFPLFVFVLIVISSSPFFLMISGELSNFVCSFHATDTIWAENVVHTSINNYEIIDYITKKSHNLPSPPTIIAVYLYATQRFVLISTRANFLQLQP